MTPMRGFTSLFAVLLLAGLPGFGQIMIPGGGGYPGGGYPGGGYPGGGYPGGRRGGYPGGRTQQPGTSNEDRSTTFTGMLRKIEDKAVIVESDDKTITTISTGGSTKYVGASGGNAKIGDFQPGDHVKVSANQDSKSNYHAVRMTMVTEGTPEEHSAASLATDDTSRPIMKNTSENTSENSPGSNSSADSSSQNDSNRPKLRRAASSSDDSSSASNNSSNSSSSSDSGGDRPKLRRAASSSNDSSSASSNASNDNSDDDPDRPRLRRAPSSTEASTSSSSNPVAGSGSSNGNNDDAPPRIRRAVSNPDGGLPAEITPDSSGATVASRRPSLHADDVNGVTRERAPQTEDPFIEQTRQAAFSFSETLPNYVVKQFTTRYQTMAARGNRTNWQPLDTVTADVIEENGTEKYKNILVNGKPPVRDVEKTGSWSRGEFSSLLQDLLSPSTNADFHGKRETIIANHAAFRYDFSVERSNSHWHVEAEGQEFQPAYSGTIWIDKQNYRVLRIEMSALNLPREFPLDTVESAIDYDYVPIGEGRYLLPAHSEALSCGRGTSGCTRNVIEFRNYRKFTAETSITFDSDK